MPVLISYEKINSGLSLFHHRYFDYYRQIILSSNFHLNQNYTIKLFKNREVDARTGKNL